MEEYLISRMSQEMDVNHKLELAEELLLYFKNMWHYKTSRNVMTFMRKLTDWIRSSSHKVQVITMKIIEVIAIEMQHHFQSYLTARDSSRVVCSSAQSLFQIIMSHCVTNPQAVMDHVVETCLAHKSFRVKRGGIICLLRTIRKFGLEKLMIDEHIGAICDLLIHKDSRVQELAMDALVDIYKLLGEVIHKLISTCNIPTHKLQQLKQNFILADSGDWTGSVEKRVTTLNNKSRPVSPRWDGSPDGRQVRKRSPKGSCTSKYAYRNDSTSNPRMSLGADSYPTTKSGKSSGGSSYQNSHGTTSVKWASHGWGSDSWRSVSGRQSTSGASKGMAASENQHNPKFKHLSPPMVKEVKVIVEEAVIEVLKSLKAQTNDAQTLNLELPIHFSTIRYQDNIGLAQESEHDDDGVSFEDSSSVVTTSSSNVMSVHIMPSDEDLSKYSLTMPLIEGKPQDDFSVTPHKVPPHKVPPNHGVAGDFEENWKLWSADEKAVNESPEKALKMPQNCLTPEELDENLMKQSSTEKATDESQHCTPKMPLNTTIAAEEVEEKLMKQSTNEEDEDAFQEKTLKITPNSPPAEGLEEKLMNQSSNKEAADDSQLSTTKMPIFDAETEELQDKMLEAQSIELSANECKEASHEVASTDVAEEVFHKKKKFKSQLRRILKKT